MRPYKGLAKFRQQTRYPHRRSEGISNRENRGTRMLVIRRKDMPCLGALEGMVIGAVNPVIITADTPIDPDQWENGLAWHIKKECDEQGNERQR